MTLGTACLLDFRRSEEVAELPKLWLVSGEAGAIDFGPAITPTDGWWMRVCFGLQRGSNEFPLEKVATPWLFRISIIGRKLKRQCDQAMLVRKEEVLR